MEDEQTPGRLVQPEQQSGAGQSEGATEAPVLITKEEVENSKKVITSDSATTNEQKPPKSALKKFFSLSREDDSSYRKGFKFWSILTLPPLLIITSMVWESRNGNSGAEFVALALFPYLALAWASPATLIYAVLHSTRSSRQDHRNQAVVVICIILGCAAYISLG